MSTNLPPGLPHQVLKMTANPFLTQYGDHFIGPQLYDREHLALRRDHIDAEIHDLRTRSGSWKARGALFLTNLRLVFVANQLDETSGLQAFDFPLAYLRREKFNQPVFGCNNLSGEVWSTSEGGGRSGHLPPHKFALSFKDGGVGTFLPLFFSATEAMRSAQSQEQQACSTETTMQAFMATALLDPSDPSKVYLAQPLHAEDRLPSAPQYTTSYGADEKYESM